MLEKTLFVVMLIPVSIMSGGLSYKAALNLWPLNGYPIGALTTAKGNDQRANRVAIQRPPDWRADHCPWQWLHLLDDAEIQLPDGDWKVC